MRRALLWRAAARDWERGAGKAPPWLETSVFRLRSGRRWERIDVATTCGPLDHAPPSQGGFVVSRVWCSRRLPPVSPHATVPENPATLKRKYLDGERNLLK